MQALNHLLAKAPTFFSNGLAFVVALGVIIFVHESGHLLMAKAFGVRVVAFSLGFGRRLWGFESGGTEYRVSLIPLGGYVKLSGEMPGEETDDPGDFLSKPRWQRFLVYLAGPVMNVILAVLLVAVVFTLGISVPNLQDIPARIGYVQEGSSAASAGLLPGDLVVAVDGESVEQWDTVQLLLMTAKDRAVELEIERGEQRLQVAVTPQPIPDQHISDTAGILPEQLLSVTEVSAGMPAAEAGVQSGDRLRTLNGQPVVNFQTFVDVITSHAGQPVVLEVARNGQPLTFTLVPKDVGGVGKIGLGAGLFQRYGLGRALVESVRYNIQIVRQTFFVLGKIFSGRIAAESALSGPLEIARYSGEAARVGLRYLLHFMGVISISIGILNLLPIPVLDGGQMVILTLEGVMRRDMSLRVKELINQVGFVLIMLIMAAVLFFDVKKAF
jgi:regulator of sigma E protease